MITVYKLCANAQVILDGDNKYLQSYETIVCRIKDNIFDRYWNGYSRTIMVHVNNFREHYGLPKISCNTWLGLPVVREEN